MKKLMLGGATLAMMTSVAQAQTTVPAASLPSTNWETIGSDIPADPAWRFGVLPNGLRYAVRRSTQPAGAISVRIRVGVGGLMESNTQQGWSHLLEHMTFRGTKRYGDGEGIRIWQRLHEHSSPFRTRRAAIQIPGHQPNPLWKPASRCFDAFSLCRTVHLWRLVRAPRGSSIEFTKHG